MLGAQECDTSGLTTSTLQAQAGVLKELLQLPVLTEHRPSPLLKTEFDQSAPPLSATGSALSLVTLVRIKLSCSRNCHPFSGLTARA